MNLSTMSYCIPRDVQKKKKSAQSGQSESLNAKCAVTNGPRSSKVQQSQTAFESSAVSSRVVDTAHFRALLVHWKLVTLTERDKARKGLAHFGLDHRLHVTAGRAGHISHQFEQGGHNGCTISEVHGHEGGTLPTHTRVFTRVAGSTFCADADKTAMYKAQATATAAVMCGHGVELW